MEVLEISDSEKTYRFEKPEFECELLKVVDEYCIGYYVETYKNVIGKHKIPTFWNLKTGNCYKGGGVSNSKYTLTPIKANWYEDESNFPVWYKYNPHGRWLYTKFVYEDRKNCNFESYEKLGYMKATQEEVNSLYYQDKE